MKIGKLYQTTSKIFISNGNNILCGFIFMFLGVERLDTYYFSTKILLNTKIFCLTHSYENFIKENTIEI